jgi:OOP family OmpA-OmpF porin
MRSIACSIVVSIFLLTSIAAAFAGDGRPRTNRKSRPAVCPNKIIYDLTIPWPFHKAQGDQDGDGVLDNADKCPDTSRGAKVDMDGCPIDSDRDGVYDGLDACEGTPRGAKVDKRGCPIDSDKDGVYDGLDKCPGTPSGARVDGQGCPIDSDKDGIYDGLDKCPGTAANLKVDKNGCPIEVSEIETQFLDTGMISTSNITFAFNKADLQPSSYKVLDEIGRVLVEWPTLEIEIGGHTDAQGSEKYNQELSRRRAQAVKDYLVAKFPKIQAVNLSVKGYGESKPIAGNDSDEGRAANRRVEFVVKNKDQLKKEIEIKKQLQK